MIGQPARADVQIGSRENIAAPAGQIGGAEVIVFGQRFPHRRRQRSFFDQIGRAGKLFLYAVSRGDFVGQKLKAGKLLVGLPDFFLQILIALTQHLRFMLQRIVISHLQRHARITAGDTEHSQHQQSHHTKRAVDGTMRNVMRCRRPWSECARTTIK